MARDAGGGVLREAAFFKSAIFSGLGKLPLTESDIGVGMNIQLFVTAREAERTNDGMCKLSPHQ